jgi:hypothetical protein
VPAAELSYIMGNPPFVGGMMMSRSQKAEMSDIFGNTKGAGELDYVSAWYKKAVDYMAGTGARAAFVSTSSITQGQQAATLWGPLMASGVSIAFACRTFKWSNEGRGRVAVHCVIVGFAFDPGPERYIYDGAARQSVRRINSYLVEAEDIFVASRPKPLCDAPPMRFGSMPRDGGGFMLGEGERAALLEECPAAGKWIRPYMGAAEFINGKRRWCLWLVGASPKEIKSCPAVLKRVESVRAFRAGSVAGATRKFADAPTLFCQIAQPDTDYILVPRVSSERREYIPMGFVPPDVIASDATQVIPGASLWHFGVLTSSVHMAWTRTVCGRLEIDYRYSKDIVYNNFPWPEADDGQKAKITALARVVLDARALYSDNSLADLYDPRTMPKELLKAHRALDAAVMKLYGFRAGAAEAEVVAALMERYARLAGGVE